MDTINYSWIYKQNKQHSAARIVDYTQYDNMNKKRPSASDKGINPAKRDTETNA